MSGESADHVEILFYFREQCSLCEQMDVALREFISTLHQGEHIRVSMRDIDDNRQWYEKYREYVPVLVVNGEEICHYFFDPDELRAAITQSDENYSHA